MSANKAINGCNASALAEEGMHLLHLDAVEQDAISRYLSPWGLGQEYTERANKIRATINDPMRQVEAGLIGSATYEKRKAEEANKAKQSRAESILSSDALRSAMEGLGRTGDKTGWEWPREPRVMFIGIDHARKP